MRHYLSTLALNEILLVCLFSFWFVCFVFEFVCFLFVCLFVCLFFFFFSKTMRAQCVLNSKRWCQHFPTGMSPF